MDMKPVDLQFAVHKNDQAGIRQQQLNHKPEMDQVLLGAENEKNAEHNRKASEKIGESEEAQIRKEGRQNGGQGGRGRQQKKAPPSQEAEPPKAVHPFKGSHIDLSL
ncbi:MULTISPECIES: hypothetical protein [Paenibacillus]|uniref:hypothetical protein n=1 Tax=Paenibacillus TaxID=44249 RepID=UPI00020D7E3C|nr:MULTISPECIES: hypothetical protein [Paenibacillus]EGL14663.1 hypothetical protein HMPREF9413_0389 [Paenibacillus sp. HGF7]EPD92043.1 hypothetical protein HMPREF1207_00709 [Paenibacillus sp. HGH0039]MBV6712945.1 hypothetical protein [Paenibacillus chitinolyticus]